jgi:hypothetical protein
MAFFPCWKGLKRRVRVHSALIGGTNKGPLGDGLMKDALGSTVL